MRQSTESSATPADERHWTIRTLSVNYPAGLTTPAHHHCWTQFVYSAQGAVRVETTDAILLSPPRRGVFIPAGVQHRLHMLSAVALRTLYFAPSRRAGDGETAKPVRVSGLLHEAIMRACGLGALDRRDERQNRLAQLIEDEVEHADTGDVALQLPSDQRARKLALMFLDDDRECAPPQDLNALCRAAGLSRRTAERAFSRECGTTPAQWRRLAGLSRAMERLTAGAAVSDAARVAGYESQSAFGDAFMRVFGVSPGQAKRSV